MPDEKLSFDDWEDCHEKFALQVIGDSMAPDHIAEGDWVIIDKAPSAKEGQIVAVRGYGGDATLGRLAGCKVPSHFNLVQSGKPDKLTPYPRDQIIGVLVGVVRKY